MFGDTQIAIPPLFENTKFPLIKEKKKKKIKTLIKNQEEALVAHELARIWMIENPPSPHSNWETEYG